MRMATFNPITKHRCAPNECNYPTDRGERISQRETIIGLAIEKDRKYSVFSCGIHVYPLRIDRIVPWSDVVANQGS